MSDCFRAGVTSQKRFVQVACLLATAAAVAAFYTNTLPLPTWEVTAVRYHEVGLNWRHLSASATLLVNLTVQSSSVFPLWFERTSVDLFFPGPQGERRPLGVGSFGGMFLTCGKNYVETEIKLRPFGIPGALAVQRTKGRTGQQVVLAMGSTEIRVLGLFPVSMVSECEHSIRTWYSVGHPLSSLPAILEGAKCSYTLGSDLFTISHSFGVPLPSPFAPLKKSLLLIPEAPRKLFQLFSRANSTSSSHIRAHQDGALVLIPSQGS